MEFKEFSSYRTETMHPDDVARVFVSDTGIIKVGSFRVRYARRGDGFYRTYKEKILSQFDRGNGYMAVSINQVIHSVHRVVAEAFIPNPDHKETVNHKNGNKKDNRPDNLEWASYPENIGHAYDNDLNPHGEIHNSAMLTSDQAIEIAETFKSNPGASAVALGKKYGVSASTIKNIKYGNAWKRVIEEHFKHRE